MLPEQAWFIVLRSVGRRMRRATGVERWFVVLPERLETTSTAVATQRLGKIRV
jgi:predicted helicase